MHYIWGTDLRDALSEFSGNWSLCDRLNPELSHLRQKHQTPWESQYIGLFTNFKGPWTQQRSSMMKSKWQLGEEKKKPWFVSKDQRTKKRTVSSSEKVSIVCVCGEVTQQPINKQNVSRPEISSHLKSYHLYNLENNYYLGTRLQGASARDLAVKYLVLTLKD